MLSRDKACSFRRTRLVLAVLASVPMLAGLSTSHAWEVKSYYPTGFSPTLPDVEEAQRLAVQTPTLLNTIRQAHRQSLQSSWKGVVAPQGRPHLATGPRDTGAH